MKIVIQSFNGIGDLLFVTPTLRCLKEVDNRLEVVVNTNYPALVCDNPFVDSVGSERVGTILGYPDPIHCKEPTCHHIVSDWKIITNSYEIKTAPPKLQPEVFIDLPPRQEHIGVQVSHKGQWHKKKVWPYFDELAKHYTPIPHYDNIGDLVAYIASCKLVVCAEGGISHIAKAVGTPAVVIYGGFANPEWNGYADQFNIMCRPECSYCYNSYPCKGDYKCLAGISVKSVIENVKILIGA